MIFKFGLSLCGSLAFLMWLSEKTKYAHSMAHKCRVREGPIMQWEHFWSEVNWLASPLSFDGFTISSLYLVLVFDKSLSPFYTLHTNSKEFLLQEERHSNGKGEPARRFSLRGNLSSHHVVATFGKTCLYSEPPTLFVGQQQTPSAISIIHSLWREKVMRWDDKRQEGRGKTFNAYSSAKGFVQI